MKKILAMLLAVMMVLGLFAGCASSQPKATQPATNAPTDAAETPTETAPAETEAPAAAGVITKVALVTDSRPKAMEQGKATIWVTSSASSRPVVSSPRAVP